MKEKYQKFILTAIISLGCLFTGNPEKLKAQERPSILKSSGAGQIDWTNKIIRVKGSGAPPSSGGEAQRRLKARVAARMDAYRNIAELINGVQVTSETTVKNFVTVSDVTKLRVEAIIKGARQLGEERTLGDGTVEIELFLPLFGNGSVASAIDLGNYLKTAPVSVESMFPVRLASLKDFVLPKENSSFKTSQANTGEITGLIINAGGLGVEPAMSPFIVGGGKIVYAAGRVDIDPDNVVRYGITDYTNDLDQAKNNKQRIGTNPMVIEASGATGKPGKTNILLDEATLKSLNDANGKNNFLKNLSVVIVI